MNIKQVDKKQIALVLIIILILLVIALFIGNFTYSYLAPKIAEDISQEGVVTASGDYLYFTAGDDISILATTDNFSSDDGNLTSTSNPKVTLIAAEETIETSGTAKATYYAGISIAENTFTYSDSTKPELILTILDENGNAVTESTDALDYVTVTDGTGASVSGFDITNKVGEYTIISNHEITTTSSTTGTTHTWTFTLTFVNYGTSLDQSINENATLDLDIVYEEDDDTSYSYEYTGEEETFTVTKGGAYKIEAWGADKYDYTVARVVLNEGDKLYINVGGSEGYNDKTTSVASVSGLTSTLSEDDIYLVSKESGTSYINSSLDNAYTFCYSCSVDGGISGVSSSTNFISRFVSTGNGKVKITDVTNENVAKVGDIEYMTLQDAFDHVPDNTETVVTLINDSPWNATVAENKNIVLDLGEYDTEGVINNGTLSLADGTYTVDNFEIYNYNILTLDGTTDITTNFRTLIYNESGATLNITDSVEITSLSSGYVAVLNYGTANMSGGTITALNGNPIKNVTSGTFTMTGGSLVADANNAVYNSGGTTTLSGGTITNTSTTSGTLVSNQSGATLNITDSVEITSLSSGYVAVSNAGIANVSGGTITALSVSNVRNNSGGTFTMTGGSLVADETYAIYNSGGTTTLSGGTIINSSTTSGCLVSNQSGATLNITDSVEITSLSSKSVAVAVHGTTNVSGGTITANSTDAVGVYSGGTLTMTGGSLVGTSAAPLYIYQGTATISDGSISATTGRAITLKGTSSTYATLTINGTPTITNSSDSYSTIYKSNSYVNITATDISGATITNSGSAGTGL